MRGIDTAREIIMACQYEPLYGDVKVIILNECHKSTNEFQNAMLEILEEPPKSVFFILCTTEPEKLLKTIKTRATTFNVTPLRKHDMINLINWVLDSEKVEITEKVKSSILFSADGCARKALVILDQIIDISNEEKQIEAIAENTPEETLVIELCRKIITREDALGNKGKDLSVMLKGMDQDAEGIRRAILGYLSAVLLNTTQSGKGKGASKVIEDEGRRIATIMAEFSNNYFYSGKAGLVTSCFLSTLV